MFMPYANNNSTDQPAHPHSLISTFVIRYLDSIISLISIFAISWLSLASVAEQAGLSVTWLKSVKKVFSWRGSFKGKYGLWSYFESEVRVPLWYVNVILKEQTDRQIHLKVECWAECEFFLDHNFTLNYHIHTSSALCFDMQPWWKFYQLIFEGQNGLEVKFWIKATKL